MLNLRELDNAFRSKLNHTSLCAGAFAILLLIPTDFVGQVQPKPTELPCNISTEDRAIYAVVLRDADAWKQPVSAASVREYTLPDKYGHWDYLEARLAPETRDLLDRASFQTRNDFFAKKSKSCYLGRLEQNALNRSDTKAGPPAQSAAKPDYWLGVIQVSRIGFNRARDEAIVYTVSNCGSLCAGGDVFLLRLVNGNWTIIEWLNIWVS
jgi:hypothetical protein